jgi:uncharacterized protein (DUF433 family)
MKLLQGCVFAEERHEHSGYSFWILGCAADCEGLRTPVKILFENLETGMTMEEVMEQFPVTREQIDSLMAFIAKSLDKDPAYA